MQPKEKTFSYYRYYFNFIYYLGLCPYRIRYANETQSYLLCNSNVLHKIFCGIFHIILCIGSMSMFLGSLVNQEAEAHLQLTPLRLFNIARAAGFPAYVFTFFYCIWFRKEKFFYLLHLVDTRSKNNGGSKELTRIAAMTLGVSTIALLFAPFHMLGEDYFYNATEWDFEKAFPKYAGMIAHNLFIQSSPSEPLELTPAITALVLVAGFLNVYLLIVIHMADTAVMIAALALHRISKDFSKVLALLRGDDGLGDSDRMIENYGSLKGIIDHINGSTGPIVVCMFFVTLPYFVENLITLFVPDDWSLKMRFLYYFTHYFFAMTIASAGSRSLSMARSNLFQVVFQIPKRVPSIVDDHAGAGDIGIKHEDVVGGPGHVIPTRVNKLEFGSNNWKLVTLYLEASASNLGLQGCGFFTITYGFLGSIVGILLTYFIVMVQFKVPGMASSEQGTSETKNCTLERIVI